MGKLLKRFLKIFKLRSKRIFPDIGILVTVPGASFDLFNNKVHSYLGFIDLSNLLHGDEIEISEYIKPWDNLEFKLHKKQKFNGPIDVPLVSFPSKTIDCPVKIVLKQNTGMRRELWYLFRYD